jgi:putative DNA primase/helicase
MPESGDDPVARARHRYAMAALDREIGRLAATPEGARGFELNKVAFSLGGLVGAGLLSETLARAELWGACERNGLVAKDGAEKTRQAIARSLAEGMRKPIDVSQIGGRAGKGRPRAASPPPEDEVPPPDPPAPSDATRAGPSSHREPPLEPPPAGGAGELDMACARLPRTDMGNARRFILRHGEGFLFVEQWGWLAWDGKRWNASEADAILGRAIQQTILAIADEARAMKGSPEDVLLDKFKGVRLSDKIFGWCLASQSNAHVSCVARLAQHHLTAAPEAFDADPMAFNVGNGTLRFKKRDGGDYVSFHRHDRKDRITKLAPVDYDPEAGAPLYDGFLARVQPDAAMWRHLHAWGGVSITALPLARLAFWYGTGRNGKSTLIDAWAHVMGDYAQTIPIESFLDQGRARRGGEASPDIAALPGIRCLRTSEPEKGSKLAESLVKLVTGGEPLRARHLNRDFFEFRPAFKMTMQGNYKPRIDGTDEGIWARILLVPWGVMIPEGERDQALPDKLRAEAPGILNRLLDGVRDYLDHGLSPTDAVIAATAEYRDDSDPIGRFLAECTARRPEAEDARVGGKEIFALYIAWAKAAGEKPWSPKAFSRGLQDHGVIRLKSSGMHYRHIVLTRSVHEFKGQEIEDDPGGR